VFFGMTADRDAIPDVEEFAVQIGEALEEILSTIPRQSDSPTPQPRRRSRSRTSS
jgi:hypothetical protein